MGYGCSANQEAAGAAPRGHLGEEFPLTVIRVVLPASSFAAAVPRWLAAALSALASSLVLLACSTAFAYYSTDSYEGDVIFTGVVEIADDTPDFLIMPSYISRQLLYLAGPLQGYRPQCTSVTRE